MKKNIKKLSAVLHKKADVRSPARHANATAQAGGDAELLRCYSNGNQQCFSEIVGRHQPELLRYVSAYVHNPGDCKDIVQDVFTEFILKFRAGEYTEQGKLHH